MDGSLSSIYRLWISKYLEVLEVLTAGVLAISAVVSRSCFNYCSGCELRITSYVGQGLSCWEVCVLVRNTPFKSSREARLMTVHLMLIKANEEEVYF